MTDEMEVLLQGLRREYLAEAPARLGELRKDLAAVRADRGFPALLGAHGR